MIKIFVHEISHAFEGQHDRDKEYYTPIKTEIHIYSNKKDLDFSDIRYWKVLEELKVSIGHYHGEFDHYGYTGDFDENRYRERVNKVLAKEICDKLNHVTKGNYFEVFELEPYKSIQCRSWDRNFYYNPKDSECCYEITDLFLGFPGIDGRFQQFLNRRGWDKGEILNHSYPILCTEPIIREREIEHQLFELKEELKKVKEQLDISNLRVKAFCRFIVPYIEKTIPNVNDVVNMYPSMHKGSCCFVGQSGNSFYPLNVVLELEEKNMINKLIELGAYKLAEGSFKDLRNPDKYQTKHSLDRLFRYCCDDAHYNMLKKNFKENSEWNETLEKLFPNK